MYYQVDIFAKQNGKAKFQRSFALTAPSRKQAKTLVRNLFGRCIVGFRNEEPEEVKA